MSRYGQNLPPVMSPLRPKLAAQKGVFGVSFTSGFDHKVVMTELELGGQMFIFGGTTEEMETLGYLGVATCQNCGKSTHHVLYQLVKSTSVYLVPVAAWGKGNYVICQVCNAGTEVSDDQKNFLIRECRQIPEPERYMGIWNDLISGWQEAVDHFVALGEKNYNFAEAQRAARQHVDGQFPEAEIDFVESWTFVPTQLQLAGVLHQVDVREPTLLMVLS